MKRALRQEANFGCCVCGVPIVEYHHIIPWHVEHHFRIEDMMCLCPNHHDEVTKGAMTESEQRAYKAAPHNVRKGYASGLLKVNQGVPVIDFHNCIFIGEGDVLSVDEEALISMRVENSAILLTLSLFDKSDKLKACIIDNEWLSGNSHVWDIEAGYQKLMIRHKKRDIGLEINAKVEPMTIKGVFWKKGQKVTFDERGAFIDGVVTNVSISNLTFIGNKLGIDTRKNEFTIGRGTISVGKTIAESIAIWRAQVNNGQSI